MSTEMFNAVKQLFKKEYQIEVHPTTQIKELSLDSLDRLELLMKIEDELDVNIPENMVTENSTIQDLIAFKTSEDRPN